MKIDFSTMNVGDEVKLPRGGWEEIGRPVYEAANEFCSSCQEPRPQFQIDTVKGSQRGVIFEYILRRVR